jgi:hypothetical protein
MCVAFARDQQIRLRGNTITTLLHHHQPCSLDTKIFYCLCRRLPYSDAERAAELMWAEACGLGEFLYQKRVSQTALRIVSAV